MANPEKGITELENKIALLENKLLNNIAIFNVEQSNRETMEELEAKVKGIIDIKINSGVDLSQIDYPRRLGKKAGK